MIVVRNNIIPIKGYKAITIWPFVFVRKDTNYTGNIVRHEETHAAQQVEMLLLPFHIWYLAEWLIRLCLTFNFKKAYKSVSFEQEARTHESDITYLTTRSPWSWVKYIFKS